MAAASTNVAESPLKRTASPSGTTLSTSGRRAESPKESATAKWMSTLVEVTAVPEIAPSDFHFSRSSASLRCTICVATQAR